jgi:hypothetical protein
MVSTQEATNEDGRYVTNFVGILLAVSPGEVFLLASEVLNGTNHFTVAFPFDNSTNLLRPDEIW